MMIANLVLAGIARIAGNITGRPVSGKWLARYFLGRSGTHSLPPELESQVLALAKEYSHQDERLPITIRSDDTTDLYTCVGTFSMQWQEDGSLRYWDTYDWHGNLGWGFDVKLGFLPFSVEIKGQDTWFAKIGREFLTAGTIITESEV